ncbi:MAG: phosphatidylserine/phosphatidylglycerophosphate/cardiolipin synthase family protein, partial [Bdellovibrionaceae bacterium]|nr:phosphatidylserine/phosphatidylglycerophosphate/cardiolipin synthase family protein [Pseudobdellovibrionaceae bacterium]
MIKTCMTVNKLYACIIINAICLIMGNQVLAQAQAPNDISEIEVLKDSKSFDKKYEIVSRAKSRIWISVMIFDCSDSSSKLFEEIIRKQEEENVDVRIMAEGLYMKTLAHPCYARLKNDHQIKITQIFDHFKKGGNLSRMMHEKFFIVDNEELILGGMNFIKYENEANEKNGWVRDTDVYLKSARLTQSVAEEFVWMWNFFSKKDKIENFKINSGDDPLNQGSCRILVQNPRRGLDQADEFITENLRSARVSLKMYTPGMKYGKADFFSILKEKVEKGFEFSLIRPGIAKQADELTMFMNDHIQQKIKNKDILGAGACFLGKCLGKLLVNSSVRSGFRSLLENYGNKINVYDFP